MDEHARVNRARFDRRSLLQAGAASVAAPMLAGIAPAVATAAPHEDVVVEATIADLQAAMAAGRLTSHRLVRAYLARIAALDRRGPKLNAVIELNPDAEQIARALDRERRSGHLRGPLHGIPVLLKHNIDTGDRMQTTAGSLALVGSPALTDSTVAARLRAAGAVILGKTNLSEWANIRGAYSSSGWSGRGGQTHNPYVLDRSPSGSSSGTGAAVAASLCAAGLGTETDGSIVSPASHCGVVGIKPTVGLTSRAGVVPISHTQDTVGPHGRTVADAAAVLGAIASTIADPRDPSTAVNRDLVHDDYVQFLDPDGLRGARIGVARQLTGFSPETDAVFEAALQTMRDAGATLVDPADIPNLGTIAGGQDETVVLFYELKRDLNAYLATRTGVPIATLADAIAFNQAHADEELLWFGQEDFEFAESDPFDEATYLEAVARERRVAGPHGIDAALKAYGVDALVMETSSPASAIDLLNGDHFLGGSSYVAAQAGYPIVQVPAGNSFGLPVGISFVGTAYGEPTLIKLASGFEAAARARIVPTFQPFLPAEAPGRAPRLSRAAVRPRGRRQGLSLL